MSGEREAEERLRSAPSLACLTEEMRKFPAISGEICCPRLSIVV